jgi:DNA end-binding protein Ku
MRAIWKGAVSFGLVNVPVRLYSATENHDVQFRQVHREDGGRIRYQRICSIDGEQVSYDDIAKGYETEDGQMVVLTEDDLANLPTQSSREIAVQKFVPVDQIDPMLLDKPYYLEPDKTAAKPYGLLRDALKGADRMAIVTVSLRARMSIAVLRVRDDVIVLQTMLWPDEIRSPELAGLREVTEVSSAELSMANMLVESLAGDYVPDDYEDDYEAAVDALVKAKLEGGEVHELPAPTESGGEVVDLLGALQRSVERAKASRGEPASAAPEAADDGDTAEADLAPEQADQGPSGKPVRSGSPRGSTHKGGAQKAGAQKTSASKSAASKTAGKGTAAKTTAPKTTAPKTTAPKTTAPKKTAAKKTAAKKTAERPAKKVPDRKRLAS